MAPFGSAQGRKPRPAASLVTWATFRGRVRRLPSADQEKIREAFDIGREAHGGQTRASGEPYFSHCIAVAGALADIGADADTIIAAFLHDTVEDTPLMLPEIERRFGASVSALVGAATKLQSEDVAQSPTLDEKIETLRKIFTFMEEDVRIMVLKLFDRLHNMQTVEFLPEERRQAVARESLDVYVKIADRLSMRDLRDGLEELCLAVLDPKELDQLLKIRAENERAGRSIIERMRRSLNASDPQHKNDVRVHYEPKAFPQLKAQWDAKGAAATGVSSVTAVFVCEAVGICYEVLGILHGHYQRETLSFQDFINAPQINGYRGLHTTIILEDGTRVRCKIRTREMEEYAHKGIATRCFDGEAKGLPDYLKWGERVAALTGDTAKRSEEFFASLQSDILGEAIVIHLPDDRTVLLPKGATALDGAFYGFSDLALRLKTVLVNGKDVAFQSVLANADSLTVELKRENAVRREWLLYAQTGLAKAKIRAALAKVPRERKIADGRALLQGVMTERRKGLIEEFKEEGFLPALKSLGLFSLDDAFIAIAEGQAEPSAVTTALFESPRRRAEANGKRRRFVLRFSVRSDDIEARQRLLRAYYKYDDSIRGVKNVHPSSSDLRSYRLVADLSEEECGEFRKEIEAAGGRGVEVIPQTRKNAWLTAAIILLWGINPVIAKWFLLQGMSVLSLVTIRFLTFFVFTTFFFAVWRVLRKEKFTHDQHLPFLAVFPAIGFAGMTVFNLAALVFMPPSVHLAILRFNTLVLPFVYFFQSKGEGKTVRSALIYTLFLAVGILVFVLFLGNLSPIGILFSVLALFSYTLYSLTSEVVLQRWKIDVRYPFLLFQIGALLGIIGLLMLLLQPISSVWNNLTLPAALFVLCCVCVPHTCYSALLKTTKFKYFTDLFLLEVPIAIAFEVLLLGLVLHPLLYVVLIVILMALVLTRWRAARA